MKKVMLFTLMSLAVSGPISAQEGHNHPPAAVQHSFQRDYPEARNPEWNSANGQWNATFTDHSQNDWGEMVAHYDHSGRHLDSHIRYDRGDVPPAVVERTHRSYPGASEDSYTRIERPGGEALFQVNLHVQGKKRTMYVDENGQERKYDDHH